MPDFTVVTFFMIVGVVQGVFLSIVLRRVKDKNIEANKILSSFVFLISLTMIGGLVKRSPILLHFPNLLAFPDAIIYLYGPFLYFYFKKLFIKETKPFSKEWLHFIPAIIFIIFEVLFLTNTLEKNWFLFGASVEGSAILLNLVYLVLSFRLYKLYVNQCENRFSFKQYPTHIKSLLIVLVVIMVFWIYAFLAWTTFNHLPAGWISYAGIWISLASITYILAFYSITQPELYKFDFLTKSFSSEKSVLEIDQEIKKNIEKIMKEEKPYLNPILSLPLLSNILDIKTHQLSKIINEFYNKNFSDFINEYRIKEFLELVENKKLENNTILSLAYESGFNSKTTFNNSFKKIIGKTPKEYVMKNFK